MIGNLHVLGWLKDSLKTIASLPLNLLLALYGCSAVMVWQLKFDFTNNYYPSDYHEELKNDGPLV